MDHAPSTIAKYWGLCLNGTMSQNITWLIVMIPPPPIPWIDRPAKSTAKSFATEHVVVPIVKNTRANRRSGRRPKLSDIDAMTGWKTALERR
jgi:hypothetical protein